MRSLKLFSKHICQADCVNDARKGVVPHCLPDEGSYGLRFVPGLGEAAAAEALANYSKLASKSRQSPHSPKSPMALKSAPNPKPHPKSAPTPQSPPKSAPAPQSHYKRAPISQPKKKKSLFPKLTPHKSPSSKSSYSTRPSSPIPRPSTFSSSRSSRPCFPREPRKLSSLKPSQAFSCVRPLADVTWLPRRRGPARKSNPVPDQVHEECLLQGGVRNILK